MHHGDPEETGHDGTHREYLSHYPTAVKRHHNYSNSYKRNYFAYSFRGSVCCDGIMVTSVGLGQ